MQDLTQFNSTAKLESFMSQNNGQMGNIVPNPATLIHDHAITVKCQMKACNCMYTTFKFPYVKA